MKKSVFILAGTLALSISCTKEIIDTQQTGSVMLNAEAAAPPQTKVAYGEDADGNYQGKWEEGDIIFGFKADGTTFDFVVESVSAESGNASLRQQGTATFSAGDEIYAIYMPGKTSADLSGNSLPVDFSKQAAEELPVLMVATATVTAGPSVKFSFENAASIVAVVNPAIPGEASDGKKVVKMTLSGHEIVSAGSVQVSGGKLSFVGNAPCNFIEKSVNALVTPSEVGYTLDNPVLIVVPAGKVDKLSVWDNKNGFSEYGIEKNAEAGKYYRISGKTFTKVTLPEGSTVVSGGVEWATANLGGDNAANKKGSLFRWADTKALYYWVGTTGTWADGYSETGFVNVVGEIYCTDVNANSGKGAYSKYNEKGLTLEPVDDVVQLTFPGTGWRIPTVDEFLSLNSLSDTYTIENDKEQYLRYKIGDASKLIIRINQEVFQNGGTSSGGKGRYWTSSSTTSSSYAAQYIKMKSSSGTTLTSSIGIRSLGYSIRPVKPVSTEE